MAVPQSPSAPRSALTRVLRIALDMPGAARDAAAHRA
jgi:hypothetical protein